MRRSSFFSGLLVAVAALTSGLALCAEEGTLYVRPLPDGAVVHAALSADAKALLLARGYGNEITVLDTQTLEPTRSIKASLPSFVLTRGPLALVGELGTRVITVLDQRENWEPVKQIPTAPVQPAYLLAPGGKHFRGGLLAIGPRSKVSYVSLRAGKAKYIGRAPSGSIVLSWDGTSIHQFWTNPDLKQYLRILPTKAYLGGDIPERVDTGLERPVWIASPTVGVWPDGLWVDTKAVYSGDEWEAVALPLTPETSRASELVLTPDPTGRLLYGVTGSTVEAVTRSRESAAVASWNLEWRCPKIKGWRPHMALSLPAEESRPPTVFLFGPPANSTSPDGRSYWISAEPGPDLAAIPEEKPKTLPPPAVTATSREATGAGTGTEQDAGHPAVEPVPCPDKTTTVCLTESADRLVTAHRDPGKVRIWDLAAAEPRQSLEISEPIALLSRGTDLLVGSVDGIISVFQDTEKGFVLARTISTDSGPISSLVAGHGEGYGGSAFAVAEKQVLYVDVASGKAETVREYSDRRLWLHCDYLGQNLVELDGSAGRGYTRQHYLEAHGAYPQKTFHGSRFPYLESPHAGPFWFSAAGLWAGYPPHPHRSFVRVRGLLFYDAADPRVFYILGEDTLVARRLDTSLKEIGTTSVDMPRWFTVMVSNGSTPVDDQPYDRETAVRWACPVTGVSKGDRLFLYFVGARDKKLYRYAGPRPGVSGADRSADEAVPGRVVVGSTVSFQIPGTEGSDATCTVADAPAGMTVKGQTVHWTPTADQLGRQRVKIRVDSGGKTWFFRHSVEVVGRSAAGGGADVELPLHLLGRNPALRDAAESNFLLVLDAGNLSVLNKDATIVVKQVSLPKPYTDIYATEEGYVCLSADGVDLLAADLQTIVRTVNLGFPTVAMACHPEHRLTYVCGLDRRDAADLQTEAKRFVVIDEHTGKWEPLPRILGDTLQVTADGRYLVVGLGILRGVRIPGLSDFLGPLGYLKARFLLTYDVSDGVPAFHEHCSRLLQHRSGPPTAALSHGGNYLGYATVPDAEDRSRPQLAVALARCRDINEIRATVPMERNDAPVTWCFHPFLPLFCVATTGGPIEVFKVSTSRNRVEKVKRISRPELGGQRIVSMRFSPDGTRLVTVVTDAIALDGAETLQSFPFPMNGDDSATAAKGFAELPEKPTTRKPKNLDLPQRPDVRVSDIEGLRAQDTNGNGGGSARDIQRALVRLEALGVEWTGMLISSRGHIISSLTPAVGDISLVVDAKGREIRLPLQVVAMSEKGGLSLLTIEKPLKTPYACLAAPGAEGTPLRLGAYDQLSREKAVCILKQGEITGAVQDVSGFPLFRCSIGGGPELAGAVVFDAVGNAVGFWLAGSDREGIALSAEAARDFLLGLGR